MDDPNAGSRILELMPHRAPFRFIDRIDKVQGKTIRSRYRFREEEYFYEGHFPGKPVTPGVILLEAMAQTGLAALGIALMLDRKIAPERIRQMSLLFALADRVQFDAVVSPGQTILVRARNLFFRRGTIRSEVHVFRENGESICSGVLTGAAVGGKDE